MDDNAIKKHSEYSQGLTSDEVAMFERILVMESVHNALGYQLSTYKESIIEFRNNFVTRLAHKYRIEQPSKVTYDRLTHKIVSVFNPSLRASKIVTRDDNALRQLASSMLIDTIKKLTQLTPSKEA
jgi:hypothetical protein